MTSRRTIVHADLDAFYASVETLLRPELADVPLIVGREDGRGVVATANYRARAFGIHSAMSAAEARKRCPDAVFIAPSPEKYREYSSVVLSCYEPYVAGGGALETVALDEAYLDVTHLALDHAATCGLVGDLRAAVVAATGGLTVSVGAASTKTAAKLASEAAKPDGARVLAAHEELGFLLSQPIEAINGIGPKTAAKLTDLAGVKQLADVRYVDDALLVELLGSKAAWLRALAEDGSDGRQVEGGREAKQHGSSRTFEHDLTEASQIHAALVELAAAAAGRLERDGARGRTVTLTVRLPDRTTRSHSRTLPGAVCEAATIAEVASELYRSHPAPAVRLLGVSVSNLTRQIDGELFSYDPSSWLVPKRRPGGSALATGSAVTHAQFGPGTVTGPGKIRGTVAVRFGELGMELDVPTGSVTRG